MRKRVALVALGPVAGSGRAATISENINFSLSGFVDITGSPR
jgi:hypothetical protein